MGIGGEGGMSESCVSLEFFVSICVEDIHLGEVVVWERCGLLSLDGQKEG